MTVTSRTEDILALRHSEIPRGVSLAHPVIAARAEGVKLWDVEGREYHDWVGGIGVLNIGHNHPAVVTAVQAQLANVSHTCFQVTVYEGYLRLAQRLNARFPGGAHAKTLFLTTGAEATENAIKIARAYTNRPAVISFTHSFHGRTLMGMTLTGKKAYYAQNFGPFASEVYRLPFPNPYRPPVGMDADAWNDWCCWNLNNALVAQIDGSALACIVIEPVMGEGGFIPTPAKFLRKFREVCDRTGAVMIADEIQSGSGRTGKMYAIEHSGVVPDLVITAKSLGAGVPVSAVTGRAEIMDAPHLGGVGSTYGGSPLACAAALAVMDVLHEPGFMEQAQTVERVVREVCEPLRTELPIGDIRGIGAMMVVAFVKDTESQEPWMEVIANAVPLAVQRGVLLIGAGLYSNCIRFLPALDIPEDILREALTAVADAVREAYGKLREAEVVPA